MTTLQDQPQEVPVVDFVQPAGFADAYEQDLQSNAKTIFIARPNADAGKHCSYILSDDSKRLYLPNTVRCFLTHAEIITVTYEDSMYGSQEKLLMYFTSVGGDPFVWRVGATSYAASSLVLALACLSSAALTGQVEVTWISKGAAVFARVAAAVDGGFVPVQLPKEALGYKLTLDELMDGLTFINKSIQSGEAMPPRYFAAPEVVPAPEPALPEAEVFEDPTPADPQQVTEEKLDELIDSIQQQPRRVRRKPTSSGKVRFTATFPDGKTVSTVSAYDFTHAVLVPHEDSWRVAEWSTDQTSASKWADSRDSLETVIVPVQSKHS